MFTPSRLGSSHEINKANTKIENDMTNCLICWEDHHVYKMQQFPLFVFSCSCNGVFHSYCLFQWIYTTQSCPICRRGATFNNMFLSWLNKKKHLQQEVGVFLRFHRERDDYSNFIILCLFHILSFFIKFLLLYCLCFISFFSIIILLQKY